MKELELRVKDLQDLIASTDDFCAKICKLCNGLNVTCKERLLVALIDKDAKIQGLSSSYRKVKMELEALKRIKTPIITYNLEKKRGGYNKLKKYTVEEILPKIGCHVKFVVTPDVSVNTYSVRLRTFKRSTICVRCGLEGTHFWVEGNHGMNNFHLNLYAINKHGHEILMTRDHILPKSMGGADTLDNMQTMCTKCNAKKGNRLDGTW